MHLCVCVCVCVCVCAVIVVGHASLKDCFPAPPRPRWLTTGQHSHNNCDYLFAPIRNTAPALVAAKAAHPTLHVYGLDVESQVPALESILDRLSTGRRSQTVAPHGPFLGYHVQVMHMRNVQVMHMLVNKDEMCRSCFATSPRCLEIPMQPWAHGNICESLVVTVVMPCRRTMPDHPWRERWRCPVQVQPACAVRAPAAPCGHALPTSGLHGASPTHRCTDRK